MGSSNELDSTKNLKNMVENYVLKRRYINKTNIQAKNKYKHGQALITGFSFVAK